MAALSADTRAARVPIHEHVIALVNYSVLGARARRENAVLSFLRV